MSKEELILYRGEVIAEVRTVNIGEINQGYEITFNNLEEMTRFFSLHDADAIVIANGRDSKMVSVESFKQEYFIENGVRLFSSDSMRLRDMGGLPTRMGKIMAGYII